MPQLNKNRINRLLPKTKVMPLQANVHGLSQTISIEEHKKVLSRNAAIVRENVVLKEQIRKLKNENVNLRANETQSDPKILDDIVIAVKLVYDEYRNLKTNLQHMMVSVDNFDHIFGRCSSVFREKYPNYKVPDFENDNGFDEFWQTCEHSSEHTSERSSASQTSSRYSMSSQERESRRKYSMDKNKKAFHIFSELSTILELSSDLRGSSGRSDAIPRLSFIGRKSNARKSSIKCSVNVTTIEENCELENDDPNHNVRNSIAENMKRIQRLCANETNLQSNDRINDSNDSTMANNSEQLPHIEQVLQRNDGSKRICSLDQLILNEPQHCSSPITSQFNEHFIPKHKTIIENENNVNYDISGKYSFGSLLVEETRFDYSELNSKMTSVLSLVEVKDTPVLKSSKPEEKLENLQPECEKDCESVAIHSQIESTSHISSKVADETQNDIRPKRNLRKINKINYSEMCIDSNSNENDEKTKRKRKPVAAQSQTQSNSKEKKGNNPKVKRKRVINTE